MKQRKPQLLACPCGRPLRWKSQCRKQRCACGRIIARNGHVTMHRSFVQRQYWIAALEKQGIAARTDEEIAAGIRTLYEQHQSAAQVGRMLGFSYQAIISHLPKASRHAVGGSAKGHGVKIFVKWHGRKCTLRELADEHQVAYHLVYTRYARGWPLAEALTTPPMLRGQQRTPRTRNFSR